MSGKTDTFRVGPRKRNRVPLSCESCRSRNKCDRQQPCQNCNTRGIQNSCTFTGAASSKPKQLHHGTPEDMRSRLQRLESLVSSMAQTSTPSDTTHSPGPSPDRKTADTNVDSVPPVVLDTHSASLVDNAKGKHFVGASHWEAVLQDLAVIREHFEEIPEPQAAPSLQAGSTALLSGISCDISVSELIENLLPKDLSDRLIYRFFDTYDPAVPSRQLLHKPTFLSTYATLWYNIDQAALTTLSIMFSVYCLALQSYDRNDDEPLDLRGQSYEMSEVFRKRAAQCLLKSNISTPTRDRLEALMLYGITEFARPEHQDAVISQWMVLGIMVRKAFHMGYHRDPDAFPNLTPFEKEMRRRTWAHVWQIDTLFSFSLGLPSSVSKSKSNVKSPRNLFEEELHEGLEELPLEHPSSVMTPVSFVIAKLNILRALAAVVEHMNSLEEHTYAEVRQMNVQLADAHAKIPDFLLIKSWGESAEDPKPLRLQRLMIRMFFDKATCTLNRTLLNAPVDKENPSLQPRQLCIDSAMSLLRIQVGFHRERNKWFRFHLSRHDFLLGAVILFLVLGNKRQSRVNRAKTEANANVYDDEDFAIIRALQQSRDIWAEHTSVSADARTACRMFDRMRDRFHLPTSDFVQMAMPASVLNTENTFDSSLADRTVQTDLGMITPEQEPLTLGTGDFAEFDWDAWENAFGIMGHSPGLDDLSTFWPLGDSSGV